MVNLSIDVGNNNHEQLQNTSTIKDESTPSSLPFSSSNHSSPLTNDIKNIVGFAIYTLTFNLSGKLPSEDEIKHLLPTEKPLMSDWDILLISTQECGVSISKSLFSSKPMNIWRQRFLNVLEKECQRQDHSKKNGDQYSFHCVAEVRMMAIHLMVFVHRQRVYPYLSQVLAYQVPTGLFGGFLGNKGGVAVSFRLYQHITVLCVNCHFHAHQTKSILRNADYLTINSNINHRYHNYLLMNDDNNHLDYSKRGSINLRYQFSQRPSLVQLSAENSSLPGFIHCNHVKIHPYLNSNEQENNGNEDEEETEGSSSFSHQSTNSIQVRTPVTLANPFRKSLLISGNQVRSSDLERDQNNDNDHQSDPNKIKDSKNKPKTNSHHQSRRIKPELTKKSRDDHGLSTAKRNAFDCVIWMGDLNYRINGNRNMVDRLMQQNMQGVMLANDQLLLESKSTRELFYGFNEGKITFPPTYKFDRNSDTYDTSSKNRVPSFTDRILYKYNHRKIVNCELTCYDSIPQVRISDHRPVKAEFLLQLQKSEDCRCHEILDSLHNDNDGDDGGDEHGHCSQKKEERINTRVITKENENDDNDNDVVYRFVDVTDQDWCSEMCNVLFLMCHSGYRRLIRRKKDNVFQVRIVPEKTID